MIIKLFTTSLPTQKKVSNSADDSPDQTVDRIKSNIIFTVLSRSTTHHPDRAGLVPHMLLAHMLLTHMRQKGTHASLSDTVGAKKKSSTLSAPDWSVDKDGAKM